MSGADTRPGLTHVGNDGRARMVAVGEKTVTHRTAVAEALVRVSPELAAAIRDNTLKKGNLLEVARLAGVQAAKRTDELIPLCHSLQLDDVSVEAELEGATVRIRTQASAHGRTGVEMEALTAAAVAALTVVDMGKAVDRSITVERIRLLEKHGGRSGSYVAPSTETER